MLSQVRNFLFPKIQISYKNSKEHILALDGLRGLAILLVLLFHMFHFMFGWCGVDLFFVLSGFLITGILIESKNDKRYFSNFWIKRILRIFPVYYSTLAIILIPKIYFQINTVTFTSWTYWVYLQNWQHVAEGVFPSGKATLNHFWSLAIEEQFYLFFPLIVKYVKDRYMPPVLLGFILLAVGFRYFYFNSNNIGYYVATFSRMDSLAIGSLIAYLIRSNPKFLQKWVHLFFYFPLLYIISVISLTGDPHFSNPFFAQLGLTFFALFFGSLLILSISEFRYNFIKDFLTRKGMVFLGKISYGLYIYHWILYVFLKPPLQQLVYNHLQNLLASKIITSLAICATTLLLSHLSFQYIEKRFLSLKHRLIYSL